MFKDFQEKCILKKKIEGGNSSLQMVENNWVAYLLGEKVIILPVERWHDSSVSNFHYQRCHFGWFKIWIVKNLVPVFIYLTEVHWAKWVSYAYFIYRHIWGWIHMVPSEVSVGNSLDNFYFSDRWFYVLYILETIWLIILYR